MRLLIVSLICASLVVVSACNCQTSTCQQTRYLEINFQGYLNVANDSLIVFYFERATGFTNLLRQESRLISGIFGMDSTTSTTLSLEDSFDYRVMLKSDSNMFEITDYLVDYNFSVKSCVPLFADQKVNIPDCPIASIKIMGAKTKLLENGSILVTK